MFLVIEILANYLKLKIRLQRCIRVTTWYIFRHSTMKLALSFTTKRRKHIKCFKKTSQVFKQIISSVENRQLDNMSVVNSRFVVRLTTCVQNPPSLKNKSVRETYRHVRPRNQLTFPSAKPMNILVRETYKHFRPRNL